MALIEDVNLLDFDRSNKGASKQRRDQINAEIATMRDLLPLPETSRQRLSQLQIMSLTCVYIRKCNLFEKLFRSKPQDPHLPDSLDFFQALTGFILVTTRDGKLLYISENVTDFLGHSMVDMKTQGDSLYDIVDKRDQAAVQAQLMANGHPSGKDPKDVSFFCRMNMSRTLKRQSGFGDVKVMHVRGHFVQITDPGNSADGQTVFMASCCPLITPELKENLLQNNTMVFKTVHQLDMSYIEVTKTAEYHMGYTTEDLSKKSWYSMIHPEDIHEAKEKHIQLIRSNHEIGNMMTVRMLHADGTPFWVNIVMHIRQSAQSQNEEPVIVCINQIVDAQEAYQIKMQSHMFSLYPTRAHELWSSQLSSVVTSQDVSVGHWLHHQSNSVPHPGYQTPGIGCRSSNGRTSVYPVGITQGHTSVVGMNQANFGSSSVVQSDKLKAMLKRKIQGPQHTSCRPKMGRISLDYDDCQGGRGYNDTGRDGHFMENYGQGNMGGHVAMPGHSVQVMQPSNYGIGVLTARKSQEVLNCRGMPVLGLSKTAVFGEQVVPDVNLPDSYLTPDPSPVSSPQPSTHFSVKTEVIDPEESTAHLKNSTSILHALEKLAAFNEEECSFGPKSRKAASTPELPMQSLTTKMEPKADIYQKRNELPIFDAFEIDNFFENLVLPESKSKASPQVEMEQNEIKKEFKEDKPCARNVPSTLHLRNPLHQLQRSPDLECQSFTQFSNIAMSGSPSSEARFDDFLSCLSEDGLQLSPIEMDTRSSMLDTSVCEDTHLMKAFCKDDNYISSRLSMGSPHVPDELTFKVGSPQLSETLSPQSDTSMLAIEDDMIEESPRYSLAIALENLAASEDSCISSPKGQGHDVLNVSDEIKQLDMLLGSF